MIEPTFEPGSGWKPRNSAQPGSEADRQASRLAARPAWVFKMRSHGKRLPAEQIDDPAFGLILAHRPGDDWHLGLYAPDAWTQRAALAFVRLVREGADGTRLYQGLEPDERTGTPRWPQTWLCTPTLEAGQRILQRMAQQRE